MKGSALVIQKGQPPTATSPRVGASAGKATTAVQEEDSGRDKRQKPISAAVLTGANNTPLGQKASAAGQGQEGPGLRAHHTPMGLPEASGPSAMHSTPSPQSGGLLVQGTHST